MSGLKQDFLYIIRLLVKRPGFTAVIVASLALGIGANTMIFTLVNGFLLRPLPYPGADRLAAVWFTPPNNPGGQSSATRMNCKTLRERSTVFDGIGCFQNASAIIGSDGPGAPAPEQVSGQRFTAGLGEVIGVKPALGRWFTLEEERGLAPVILISYAQWQSRFAGSPDVVGQRVHVDSNTVSIIGVMPKDFNFMNNDVQYWEPWRDPAYAIGSPARVLTVVARLKSASGVPQAQGEMNGIASALATEFPRTNKNWGIRVQKLSDALSAGATAPLLTFQGAVIFVLLIACANVAGLLLAQGAAQQKELAVRSALGSSRWRIIRQLLTESVLLALTGGFLGFFVGWAGFKIFMSFLPPIGGGVQLEALDLNVFLFTILLSLITGIVFGIVPAYQISRPDLMEALRENSRSATATAARQRLRSVFVVVQVSLALVLLIGAGLLMKSFLHLSDMPVGFDYDNMAAFDIQFPQGGNFLRETGKTTAIGSMEIEFNPNINRVSEAVRERLAATPGIVGATAVAVTPPLSGGSRGYNFIIEGSAAPAEGTEGPSGQWYPILGDYFRTLGIPLRQGRVFDPRDTEAGLPVVIINETAARRYWPKGDALGKRITVDFFNDKPRAIVGIVADVKQNMRQQEPAPQMYVPFAQLPTSQAAATALGLQYVTFVAHTSGRLDQIVPTMRAAVSQVDSTLAVSNMRTLNEIVSRQLTEPWIYSTLLSIFGSIAVLLSVVGIYGIMAHTVSQRTSEIGVRVALGASARDVLRLILRRGLLLIGIGIGLGIPASLGMTQVIRRVLYGVTPTDPLTFVLALVALAGAGFVACYLPARRALRIDPVIALRAD